MQSRVTAFFLGVPLVCEVAHHVSFGARGGEADIAASKPLKSVLIELAVLEAGLNIAQVVGLQLQLSKQRILTGTHLCWGYVHVNGHFYAFLHGTLPIRHDFLVCLPNTKHIGDSVDEMDTNQYVISLSVTYHDIEMHFSFIGCANKQCHKKFFLGNPPTLRGFTRCHGVGDAKIEIRIL